MQRLDWEKHALGRGHADAAPQRGSLLKHAVLRALTVHVVLPMRYKGWRCALTFYDTPAFVKGVTHASEAIAARHAVLGGDVPSTSATAALSRLTQRQPVGLAISATARGLAVQTTAASAPLPLATTPNEGAGMVGHNVLLYASMDNLGHLIKSALSAYGPLIGPSFSLPQIETQVRMQLGIDLEQEVFPLLSAEFVLDLNDGTPPLLAAYAAQMAGQKGIAQTGDGGMTRSVQYCAVDRLREKVERS